MYSKVPKLIRFILSLFLFEILLFTLFRVAFYIAFSKYDITHTFSDSLYSFWLGFRFDVQLIAISFLPILLFGGVKYIGIFKSTFAKYFWLTYIFIVNLGIILVYIVDFPYYDFFKKMVDSSIIRYFYDIEEAMAMLWEGYPLFSTSIAALFCLGILYFIIKIIFEKIEKTKEFPFSAKQKIGIYTLFFLLYVFSGYGKVELYPWRWSEAFYSSNNFLSYLASNPVTYFTNTLKNSEKKYDVNETKESYDVVADFLDVRQNDSQKLRLVREVTPNHVEEFRLKKPNIIFILGESTSYARSSVSGNPLDATPFIKYMSDNGLTYSRYYTPHSGTARSVWTAMTGLTDVERMKTSSRNPMTVEQNMILNSLKDYEKFYFIGGSLSWGNVRGVVSNVDGMHKYEEKDYKNSSHNDVWGISDIHLANEVNSVLKNQKKPFFAFVQLSGNHSPNTIPKDNYGFKKATDISEDDLMKYAFDGKIDEYNGQKFLDYSVQRLVHLAKKESYFENTVFIFVGDHGLPKRADHMPDAEQLFKTATVHTPLVIYAPKLLPHKTFDYPVSEVDIMATVAGLSGEKYINSTMGRDILDKDFDAKEHYSFYMTHENNPKINIIGKEYILRMRADGSDVKFLKYDFGSDVTQNSNKEEFENYFKKKMSNKEADAFLEEYFKNAMIDQSASNPILATHMQKLCKGIYELTKYTRYHNSTVGVKQYLKENTK